MSAIQTRPAYSTARSDSSLSSTSPFTFGYSLSTSPMVSFDSNPIPSNSGSFYTKSSVVKDLSVDWIDSTVCSSTADRLVWGPQGPVTSYMVSTQSNFMTSTSSNSQSGVQRFFQEFRLPDYTLDSFSGRLLDVVSSMTFSSGDIQAELHHAITEVNGFLYMYLKLKGLKFHSVFGFLNCIYDFLLYI